jgi:S1-C subfamily serine protease
LKLLTAAALLLGNLFLPNFAQAAGESSYSRVGWWEIVYKEVDDSNSCYAVARFNGETTIQLSLIQSDYSKQWVVFISNPQWNVWVERKKQHILRFAAAKRFWGTFSVTENNSLFLPVSIEFVNSLADAHTLTIMSANNYVLTHLDMKDSEAAIRAVVHCVRDHPPNSSPPPVAQTPPITRTTSSSGTAFFIAPNRLVTSNHVVKECRNEIQVRYPDRRWYTATMSGQDEANDLALLHTDMENFSTASFRLQSRVGEQVAAYGFPYAGLLSSSGNFTMGSVAALSGMNDDTRFIQISAQVQPGNSGGPLLDMSGSVIGVVQLQLNALTMMQFSGTVPQNVNFATQAPIVVNFLTAKGENPKSDSSIDHRDLPPADVADLAKKFTVQVYCGGTSPKTSEAAPPPPNSPNLPAPTNPPALEQEAKQFVVSLQARWSRPNTEALAGLSELYTDEVVYYGKMTKKDAVIKDEVAFARRFSQREYKAREPISVWCKDSGVCTVSGLLDFRAIDPVAKILSEGVSTFEYKLIFLGNTVKISLQNGEVQSRTRTPLSDSSAVHGATW